MATRIALQMSSGCGIVNSNRRATARLKGDCMDAIDLVHYIRAWTPGPGYPDKCDCVFRFENDALEAVKKFGEKIRGECIIESKHMYQVGFEHGQNNVMYVLRELITPLLDSVGQRAVHSQEWECEQVDIIRKYLKIGG